MEILNNAFNLIFAFDEIVALGYRESVNLAQIRTFVEMDSHEERVYQAVRQVIIFSLLYFTTRYRVVERQRISPGRRTRKFSHYYPLVF